jgi:hypothetical protein
MRKRGLSLDNALRCISFLLSSGWYAQLSADHMKSIDEVVRNPGPYGKLLDTHDSPGMAAFYLESTRASISKVGHLPLFRYLIHAHRVCEATDPRDKIYAFLGLAWQETLPFTTYPEAIVPDYSDFGPRAVHQSS